MSVIMKCILLLAYEVNSKTGTGDNWQKGDVRRTLTWEINLSLDPKNPSGSHLFI